MNMQLSKLSMTEHPTHEKFSWHIHADAASMGVEFKRFLMDMGFKPDNFVPGSGRYEPFEHTTWKGMLEDVSRYKDIMRELRAFMGTHGYATSDPNPRPKIYAGNKPDIFRGYVEAEHIPVDIDLPSAPFHGLVTPPVRLELRQLLVPFRTSEIHVSMDKDLSDPRTLDVLRNIGMYEVLMPKPLESRTAIIFTVQSESREQIRRLAPVLEELLVATGGVSHGSIKIEDITDYLISDPDLPLPPVLTDDCV